MLIEEEKKEDSDPNELVSDSESEYDLNAVAPDDKHLLQITVKIKKEIRRKESNRSQLIDLNSYDFTNGLAEDG